MTTTSTNLGLILYNATTDQSGSFISWTNDVAGSSVSNMTIIDTFAGDISGSLTDARSQISGSITAINSDISTITSSISTLSSAVDTLNLKLQKIDEFEGLGQADFTDIPQDFKHLIIMGLAAGTNGTFADVGLDFNGDANSGNYIASQWLRDLIGLNTLQVYTNGGVIIGSVPNYLATDSGSVFGIIPNYSASGGLYKTAMGFSSSIFSSVSGQSSIINGVWKNTVPITRIRAYITGGTYSTRYNFRAGTLLSLYGFG